MMQAIWNGVVLAESDDTVVVEGNHYFPAGSLTRSTSPPATPARSARGRDGPATSPCRSAASSTPTPPDTMGLPRNNLDMS